MSILKIDLDIHPPKEWLDDWIRTRKMICWSMLYQVEAIDVFETTRGLHVYIRVKQKLKDEEINWIQFLLGDDHTRVKINQWRIKRGMKHWNKLFHKVLYRKKAQVVECFYCGNKIPIFNNTDHLKEERHRGKQV